jgi:hypothetical protein
MGRANFSPTDRVRELTWAMVDDFITDAEWSELQQHLNNSAEARLAYIEAIQLHSDLLYHFKEPPLSDSESNTSSVLGFLGDPGSVSSPLVPH